MTFTPLEKEAAQALQAGDIATARTKVTQALQQNPNSAGALHVSATLFRTLGKNDSALKTLQEAHLLDPNNGTILIDLCMEALQAKQSELAQSCIAKMGQLKVPDVLRNLFAGTLAQDNGNLEQAEINFGKAAQYNSSAAQSLMLLQTSLQPLKNWPTIVKSFAAVKRTVFQDYQYNLRAALGAWGDGDMASLKSFLEKAQNSKSEAVKASPDQFATNMTLTQRFLSVEDAYEGILADIAQDSSPASPDSSLPTLHFIGDSHVIAPCHQKVTYEGTTYQIESALITGIKAWHIGQNTPTQWKSSLQFQLEKVGKSAQVALSIGEIDCRPDEGMWTFAAKSGTPLKQIITQTVAGYVNALQSMDGARKFIISGTPKPTQDLLDLLPNSTDAPAFTQMVADFNTLLKNACAQRGWTFVDIYNATQDKSMFTDRVHLKPTVFAQLLSS